jgi:hypothetical protein
VQDIFALGTKGMIAVAGDDGLAMVAMPVVPWTQVESELLGVLPCEHCAFACPINNSEAITNSLMVFFILILLQ